MFPKDYATLDPSSNDTILSEIQKLALEIIYEAENVVKTGGDWDSKMTEITSKVLETKIKILSLPRHRVEEITPLAIAMVDNVIQEKTENCMGSIRYMELCTRLLWTVIYSSLTKVDISKFKSNITQSILIALLEFLQSTTTLKFPEINNPVFIEELRFRITGFPNLRYFDFKTLCTDEIIQSICENCPRILVILVNCSKRITDKSVPFLSSLQKLKTLNIHSTSISTKGYREIISRLKHLHNICWNNEGDDLITDIETQDLSKIKYFAGNFSSSETLVTKCPNIISLCLIKVETDLLSLSALKSLEVLHMFFLNFSNYNVRHLFPNIAHIKELEFGHIDQLDICLLIKNCVFLKKLTVQNSVFSENEMVINPASEHFSNLRNLTLISNTNYHWYASNVKYYNNLSSLTSDIEDVLVYQYFDDVLSNNGFKNLEIFIFTKSKNLDIRTALRLMKSCPKLRVLGKLGSWGSMNDVYIKYIRNMVKVKKYNLELII
ncbi:hypothetical protein L9F63_016406 [Diploptera punctata]|uniref:Uncharacterized protein n=1 Tax=Diploptera punctata TaxID=6984 RepID=A0AAD8A1C4_DIPPU|nr:hypothetical protein L9F63_016406 [Diploptera punctata]